MDKEADGHGQAMKVSSPSWDSRLSESYMISEGVVRDVHHESLRVEGDTRRVMVDDIIIRHDTRHFGICSRPLHGRNLPIQP